MYISFLLITFWLNHFNLHQHLVLSSPVSLETIWLCMLVDHLWVGWRANLEDLFWMPAVVKIGGYPYQLLMLALNIVIKKRFFGACCVQLWNSLPTYVVESDSLAAYKRLPLEVLGMFTFSLLSSKGILLSHVDHVTL